MKKSGEENYLSETELILNAKTKTYLKKKTIYILRIKYNGLFKIIIGL